MSSPPLVLDTDTLSLLMRGNDAVMVRASAYLEAHRHFTISIITQYEILRGLKAKRADRQASRFDEFCRRCNVLLLTEEVVRRAATIYGELYQRGQFIGDADILIAGSALANGFGIVTNNEKHFRRVADLYVENWLTASG